MVADVSMSTLVGPASLGEPRPMTPVAYRVAERRQEAGDVTTLSLEAVAGARMAFRAGQFNMLTAFGIGESAISVSSSPLESGSLRHTVRDVGPVTHALCTSPIGAVVGIRGPFGTDWGVDDTSSGGSPGSRSPTDADGDVVVVAGGIGLAPLRGAIEVLMSRPRHGRGQVFVIVGAREPSQIIFNQDLERWARAGARIAVTVDVPDPRWAGNVGLVTSLLDGADFNPAGATALVCGPEIMMRFTARALIDRGVDPGRVRVSLERNMQCGVAWCGHCQLGPFLLCRDGPVLPYETTVAHLLTLRER